MAHRDVRRGFRSGSLPLFVVLLVIFAGVADGAHAADVDVPAQSDAVCSSDCGARGYDGEYCARACAVPPASSVPADELIDLRCQASCRKRGGTFRSCRRECARG